MRDRRAGRRPRWGAGTSFRAIGKRLGSVSRFAGSSMIPSSASSSMPSPPLGRVAGVTTSEQPPSESWAARLGVDRRASRGGCRGRVGMSRHSSHGQQPSVYCKRSLIRIIDLVTVEAYVRGWPSSARARNWVVLHLCERVALSHIRGCSTTRFGKRGGELRHDRGHERHEALWG
jgi:hypothetical protein